MRVVSELDPDIILLDLVMPGIDGLALLAALVADPATAQTPVIVLSGNDDEQTRRKVLAQGATDFLVKVPSRPELIACIHRHAPGATVAATPQADAPRGAAAADEQKIGTFLKEASHLLETLREAVRRADMPAVTAAAHALRATASTAGATRLETLSAQLEDRAGRGSPRAVASALVRELDLELIDVRRALDVGHNPNGG